MKKTTENTKINTLGSCLNGFVRNGYTEYYKAELSGLKALKTGKIYKPEEVKVVDFHRFEGKPDPGDQFILFAIETNDGSKGTLVDSFGPETNVKVATFILQVEEIAKKVN